MKLSELLGGAGVIICEADLSREVSGIVSDSRNAVCGCVFVCRKGERYDPHDEIPTVIAKGAICVLSESYEVLKYSGVSALVGNIMHAEAVLYSKWYGDPGKHMEITAVTGTNGKTSVCSLLHAIANKCYGKSGIIGTLGAKFDEIRFEMPDDGPSTTPYPAELYRILDAMYRDGVRSVAMEASSHSLVQHRLDGIYAKVGVFTNLSRDHLDYHRSMDDYLAAKAKLFDISEICLANADDECFPKLCNIITKRKIYGFSVDPEKKADAEYRAENIKNCGISGIEYDLVYPSGKIKISSPMIGNFAVYNTVAAASAAIASGKDPLFIAEAIKEFGGVCGRMEKIVSEDEYGFSVFIDYAHTPDALEGALETLRSTGARGRLIALFGCGGDRDKGKRPIMGHIATTLADIVIVTDDNPRTEQPEKIISDITSGADGDAKLMIVSGRRNAIETALAICEKGDIILLAGKGHEDYEILYDGKHHFSEREIVYSFLNKQL